MLIVSTKLPEPVWTPVLGAEMFFAPIDRTMIRRARKAALARLDQEDLGGEDADPADQLAELGDALSYELILAGTRDWRDVRAMAGDDDDGLGADLPFTPDNLRVALSDPVVFEAFDIAYVQPFASRERERAAPGNGFAASPNGTGEAATAEPTTVASVAAEPTADAVSARTASKRRKRMPKRTSGAS